MRRRLSHHTFCQVKSSSQQVVKITASNAGGTGLIPGRGTKIPHPTEHSKKEKRKKEKTRRMKVFISLGIGKNLKTDLANME